MQIIFRTWPFSLYKSAAARLESFSDNSSFPQIDDVLFIAPL